MNHCPHCEETLPYAQYDELVFEICQDCGLILLDFGPQRPHIYEEAEAQTRRWDERVYALMPKGKAVS